jgi:hypothetical protein
MLNGLRVDFFPLLSGAVETDGSDGSGSDMISGDDED